MLFFLFHSAVQANSKNKIRILVDRLPTKIQASGITDLAGRRIQPLLEHYRIQSFDPLSALVLTPATPNAFLQSTPDLEFLFIPDETTRALWLQKAENDGVPALAFDALNLAKTEWLKQRLPQNQVRHFPGPNFSYLGFNHRKPDLKLIALRRQIGRALPIQDWAKQKWKNWVVPAALPADLNDPTNPTASTQKIIRKLVYLTTPIREGREQALMVREALAKAGIEVELQMVEPTLYFSRLKSGEFDLFSTRILRTKRDEPIAPYLKTGGDKNYLAYSSQELDQFLEQHPAANLEEIWPWIQKDSPFVPLYYWNHAIITTSKIRFPADFVFDETFRFLNQLTIN